MLRDVAKARLAIARVSLSLAGKLPDAIKRRWSKSSLAKIPRRVMKAVVGTEGAQVYRIVAGEAKGLKIKTDLRFYRGYMLGTYEPDVVKLIAEIVKAGMVCMDIGAHHGYYSILLSSLVGSDGMVYSFEAASSNFEYLEETICANRLNNIICYNLAVGKKTGTAFLSLADSSSMHRVVTDLKCTDKKKQEKEYEVEMTCLDDFVKNEGVKKVDFVKIDVEGMENDVLRGMESVLFYMRPLILCEFHGKEKFNIGEKYLSEKGYIFTSIIENNGIYWAMAKPSLR